MTEAEKEAEAAAAEESKVEWTASMLLTLLWRYAERQEVCPLCVLHCAMDMVTTAEEEGIIGHGIPVTIDAGTETMQ